MRSNRTERVFMDFSIIVKYMPMLVKAMVITIELALVSGVIGLVIGLFTGLAKLSKNPFIHGISVFYIWSVRSTPLLVQLFIIYYGLPQFGLDLSPMIAGIAGLSLNIGAYNAETIRAGIQSIEKGQTEASRSLGFSVGKTMQLIILPQALRVATPSLSNNFIILTKDTTLVSTITVVELLFRTQQLVSATYKPFELYCAAAILYAVMTSAISYLLGTFERHLESKR